MIPLPRNIRKNGFEYSLLLRGHKACIFRQRGKGWDGDYFYYEIFLVKIRSERNIANKVIESREWFPPDRAFGKWAWTYKNYSDAYGKFKEIECSQVINPNSP